MYFLICCLWLLLSPSLALDFTGFEPFPDPPQEFSTIELGFACPSDSDFVGRVTAIRWTIEPVKTDAVVISSSPPGLVDASATDDVLRFNYNSVSLSMHTAGAGVRVQVPEAQLEGIVGAFETSFNAQVLTGFTNLASIVIEAHDAILVVYLNNTDVGLIDFIDIGRSNDIIIGTNVDVEVRMSGNSSTVTVDGTITHGIVSGSNNLLWAGEAIEQLTVSGERNRIFTDDGAGPGCANVLFQEQNNVCDLTSTEIPVPPSTVTSEQEIILRCGSSDTSVPNVPLTSAATRKQTMHAIVVAAGFFWDMLT